MQTEITADRENRMQGEQRAKILRFFKITFNGIGEAPLLLWP
jgi:hypothetical protein